MLYNAWPLSFTVYNDQLCDRLIFQQRLGLDAGNKSAPMGAVDVDRQRNVRNQLPGISRIGLQQERHGILCPTDFRVVVSVFYLFPTVDQIDVIVSGQRLLIAAVMRADITVDIDQERVG